MAISFVNGLHTLLSILRNLTYQLNIPTRLVYATEKGGDDLRRWALNVMHLLRKHNQPDMWTHVAGLIVKNGTLDVSEVITIANIPDLAFLLVSGVACDVTRLE